MMGVAGILLFALAQAFRDGGGFDLLARYPGSVACVRCSLL